MYLSGLCWLVFALYFLSLLPEKIENFCSWMHSCVQSCHWTGNGAVKRKMEAYGKCATGNRWFSQGISRFTGNGQFSKFESFFKIKNAKNQFPPPPKIGPQKCSPMNTGSIPEKNSKICSKNEFWALIFQKFRGALGPVKRTVFIVIYSIYFHFKSNPIKQHCPFLQKIIINKKFFN